MVINNEFQYSKKYNWFERTTSLDYRHENKTESNIKDFIIWANQSEFKDQGIIVSIERIKPFNPRPQKDFKTFDAYTLGYPRHFNGS